MSILAVIPARFASSRLPGKPLADICGKPMIQHVYERALRASLVDGVLVATDDERIAEVVRGFGGKAVMTSVTCASGSDRMLEAAASAKADIFINIQGDEPLLDPEAVNNLARTLQTFPDVPVATLCCPINAQQAADPNIVKVVRDSSGNALYFSRAPIPHPRNVSAPVKFWAHIGIYAYRAEALQRFGQLPSSPLELVESLEQLRLLQAGISIRVLETKHFGPAVDTPEDLECVRRIVADKARSENGTVGESIELDEYQLNEATGKNNTPDERLARIRLVITDVDGVLTDGGLYYGPEGECLKRFHSRDGLGIKMLQKAGIRVAALSGRDCPALRARLRDLGMDIFRLGQTQKEAACAEIMAEAGCTQCETMFVGDDVPDMRAFILCGLGVAVADAPAYVRNAAHIVLTAPGGNGAFRELTDTLLAAHGREDLVSPTGEAPANGTTEAVEAAGEIITC